MQTIEAEMLGTSITELVQFTWDIVVRMRDKCASDIDVEKAQSMARQLRAMVEYYDTSNSDVLSVTTLWVAREVAEAVDTLSIPYKRSSHL